MARESSIHRSIIEWLKSQGYYAVKYHGGPYSIAGTPDILASVAGQFVGIEVKRPGEFPTKLQTERGQEIQASGGYFFVAYNLRDTINFIRSITK